ncbi:MAG TPA: HIT domain-containing protein [Patescibacteria group bacterium]|nr:HIT domain-containing protein [Patescibacteria group bacterium]
MLIVETDNFTLESHETAEVSRTDGGHLVINPKVSVNDRTELAPELVKEMALLTNLAGRAMKDGLAERGIELGRINYQDNGNWRSELHVHLYGRAIGATYHIYGEPIKAARTKAERVVQESLAKKDCQAIRKKALEYAQEKGYEKLNLR